ncbi:hypothetical protein MHTCC0001_18070 [Flavobacteriaceae bacterium MHTCC 0001]
MKTTFKNWLGVLLITSTTIFTHAQNTSRIYKNKAYQQSINQMNPLTEADGIKLKQLIYVVPIKASQNEVWTALNKFGNVADIHGGVNLSYLKVKKILLKLAVCVLAKYQIKREVIL